MAELIEQIVSSEALAQVKELKNELGQTLEKFTANVNSAKILNSVLARAEGMQATNDALKKQSATLDEVEKLKKQLVTTNQKLVASETVYNQLLLEEKQRLNEANAETRRHIKEKNAEIGSYNQLEAQLSKMSKQYKAMGEAQRNSASGKDFLNNLQKTEMQLKSLDATMGSHKRNVGNYQNQLFGLTQVFREIPAFTFSAQTGLLGISNNLHILADNFSNVAKATNEVTGKVNGTTGALKIFASSIFSFGNVFAIAIGLFTIFSKEIFEFIEGTKEADKVISDLGQSVGNEVGKFDTLRLSIQNLNISEKERMKYAKEMKNLYPEILSNYSAEEIMAGKAAGAIMQIRDALIAVSLARAGQSQMDKEASKYYDLEQKRIKAQKRLSDAGIALTFEESRGGDIFTQSGALTIATKEYKDAKNELAGINKTLEMTDKNMRTIAGNINFYTNKFKGVIPEQTTRGSYKGATLKSSNGKVKNEIDPDIKNYGEMALKYLREQQNKERDIMDGGAENAKIKYEKILAEKLKAKQKADAEELELIRTNLEAQDKMFDEADKQEEERMRNKMEKLHAIYEIQMGLSELALNVSDAIAQKDLQDLDNKEKKQQEYFEAEIKRIEESSALGINKEKEKARVEAENNAKKKQFERERIEIQRRQAKFQKAADVSSIISSTALAIIKQLVATPLPAGAPFVAAIGLAGAAQLAKVIGTPLPQYFAGIEDHKGGLAIVGDKYGKEIIVEPSGKTYFTPDTDTLVNLPAHSKVIPNKDISDYLMNNKIGFAPHYNESKLEFEDVTNELKLLRKDLKGKNMSMSVINYGDFYGYIQKKIK